MKDEFARFHPLVNLIFFVVVLGITTFQMQLGLVIISVVSALVYFFYLKKSSGMGYLMVVMGVFVISSCINPVFSHRGNTLLFYLFTGNPVTLESIIYGMVSATIICEMLLWFSTFHQVMGMERMLGAIGKIMPHIALLITMIVRFIPKYIKHQKQVLQYNGDTDRSLIGKIKKGCKVFSITTTWALENAIDTADSMKSRGFGVRRRTSYSNYRIEGRDIGVIIWIVILSAGVIGMLRGGWIYTYYYPYVDCKNNILAYVLYALLCLTPVFINIREEIRWRRLKSKI